MKKFTSLSLICVIISHIYSYDYQAVLSNRVALYQSTSGMISGMKIDSVVLNGDSIFYPMKNIQQIDDFCFDEKGASWLGNKIIISPEWNYFFNVHADTIKIKTNARYHERWKFFENDEVIIEAMVIFHDTMTILGLVDSVKTIDLQAYYKSEPTGRFAHGILLLSKHFGLIKTDNLHVFPGNHQYYSPTHNLEAFTLVGMENPELGAQNLRWFDVFDFQPGDEFHTEEQYFVSTTGPATNRIFRNIRIIKNREDFADSIVYQIQDRNDNTLIYGQHLIAYEFSDVENSIVIKQNRNFDFLPGQPYIQNDYLFSNYMELQHDLVCKGNTGIPYSDFRVCWTNQPDEVSDVCNTDKTLYYKGLGGPYYHRTSGCWEIETSTETRTLLYYKKGATTWGTPIVISGLDKLKNDAGISVYSNALKEVLCIKLSNPVNQSFINIYDLTGVLLFHKELSSVESEIDLKTYHHGMYVYQVGVDGKIVKNGKFAR